MFYYVITLALDYIVFIILRFCFSSFITVYKNIYFVPSFFYIPQISWYSVWFLISERTRDYCFLHFSLLIPYLQRYTQDFVSIVLPTFICIKNRLSFSYKHYAHFPAGGWVLSSDGDNLVATRWTTQLKTNETFMNVPKKLQMQQSVCVFMWWMRLSLPLLVIFQFEDNFIRKVFVKTQKLSTLLKKINRFEFWPKITMNWTHCARPTQTRWQALSLDVWEIFLHETSNGHRSDKRKHVFFRSPGTVWRKNHRDSDITEAESWRSHATRRKSASTHCKQKKKEQRSRFWNFANPSRVKLLQRVWKKVKKQGKFDTLASSSIILLSKVFQRWKIGPNTLENVCRARDSALLL